MLGIPFQHCARIGERLAWGEDKRAEARIFAAPESPIEASHDQGAKDIAHDGVELRGMELARNEGCRESCRQRPMEEPDGPVPDRYGPDGVGWGILHVHPI